jgi:hypothetical protein
MTLKSHFREAKGIISDSARLKLEGRIYPAIKSCVRNRYLIVSGFFGYSGLLVSRPDIRTPIYDNHFGMVVPIVFASFMIHNAINYIKNGCDQVKIEEGKHRFLFGFGLEICLTIVAVGLFIIGGCILGHLPRGQLSP